MSGAFHLIADHGGGLSDEWYTPKFIFDALGCHFDLDVASPYPNTPGFQHTHVPTDTYYCHASLKRDWYGFVWMNPPFGGRNALVPWLDKFMDHGNGIALVPDRTSAPWWQNAANRADAICFLNGKVKFIRPDGSVGKSPGNGTVLFASGVRAVRAFKSLPATFGVTMASAK